MGNFFTNILGASWRSSLLGLLTALMAVPGFVTAIQAWGNHQVVDWRSVIVSTALALIGTALTQTKDKQVHSTQQEVKVATIEKEEKP